MSNFSADEIALIPSPAEIGRDCSHSMAADRGPGLPPVIVLSLFYSGLGIVRQMSGRGVKVVGLSADQAIYGNFTRFCEVRRAPGSNEQPQQLFDFLLRASVELKGAVIFPTRDADLIFLDRFREELGQLYKLAIPQRNLLFRLLNKASLAEAALAAGVATPRTRLVAGPGQLKDAATFVEFPCVIKPVSSIDWRQSRQWKQVGSKKAFRAENFAQLQALYDRLSRVRHEVLLQEWVPGATDQIVVWGSSVKLGREWQPYFTARKVLQSPEEFGTGCVVENVFVPELIEPSQRLCSFLGYEGVVEIEFKRDPRDATFKLIEVNPRHWDWHELSNASHVNLTWSAYCDLTGRQTQAVDLPWQRTKWIAEDAWLTHLLAELYAGRLHLSDVRKATGRRMYGIFAWNDPVPLLQYAVATLLPFLARAAKRKVGQSLSGEQ